MFPFTSRAIAFSVRTLARGRNDYRLGPFFSENGSVTIVRADLERAVAATLDFGLMDHYPVADCFSLVEIRAWTVGEVNRAIEARQAELKQGRFFSRHETEWWGSPDEYVRRLSVSGNRNLQELLGSYIRDEWDGTQPNVVYEYRLPQSATA